MDQLNEQAIRAVLDDLRIRIEPTLSDPTASATLGMAQRLLAYQLVHKGAEGSAAETMQEELRRLAAEEIEEDAIVSGKTVATTHQPLTVELLEPYLQARLDDKNVRVTAINATLGGFSKLTYIVSLSGAEAIGNELVIRRDPEFGPVEIHAAQELPILQAMYRHGVAVAQPLWADDATPFGGSVLVTRCAAGQSVFGKSALGLEKSAPAGLALARVLAKVHQVPIAELGLPGEIANAPVAIHVERILDDMKDQWQRRRLCYSPTIDAVFAWVRANIPRRGPGPTLVHGDASLRNFLVFDDKESALIDWELWHIGDPTEDLACCKHEIEQIMPWEQFMSEYRSHGGCAYDAAIGDYYGLFIPLWSAVLTGCCIHGFEQAAHPELRVGFAGTYHHRRLIREIAQRLSVLSN